MLRFNRRRSPTSLTLRNGIRFRRGRLRGVTDDPLREPSERVSPRAVRYWTARALALWAVIVALQVVWLWSTSEAWTGPHHVFIALSVLLALLHAGVMPRWR